MRCLWEKGVDDELMKLIEEFSNRVNPKLKKKTSYYGKK